jgi:hypothetical protein
MAAAATAALVLGHAVLAVRNPLIDLALAVLCVFVFFPPVCRAILIGAVAVGATFNPPVLGLGGSGGGGVVGGRVYVVQALLVLVIIGGVAFALRGDLRWTALLVAASATSIVLLQTVGRPHAGPAWTYRPLQLFLVAFAVRALFKHRDHRRLLMALAWGSAVGCALASIHALAPTFDPFSLSRPDNQPFQSLIGSFARATGAFTYPNNLGTFAAYVVLLGAAALLLGRPLLPRPLAVFVVVAGGSALLLSGSRAAGFGLLCGLLYLTVKLAPRRRSLILAIEALVGLVIVLAVLSSPSAAEVAQQRIDTAAGESLSLRLEGSRTAYEAFQSSPVIGTGANEGRTDNFWLLYLSQGGVVGAALYVLLARTSLRPGSHDKGYPELWVAILIALGTSGLLQDSLGQTLATWFPGVLLGICALAPAAVPRGATGEQG